MLHRTLLIQSRVEKSSKTHAVAQETLCQRAVEDLTRNTPIYVVRNDLTQNIHAALGT